MITTIRAARFLQRLPETDAAALLDAVHEAAADPLANPVRCKHLAPRLYECRVSLPPSRQFRLMFSYRRDGVAVLLSACLKKNNTVHERAIRAARQEITSAEPREGVAMSKERPIFHVTGWIYDSTGRQLRVVHHTRRKIVVQTDAGPVELSRARLERDGCDHAGGVVYSTVKHAA